MYRSYSIEIVLNEIQFKVLLIDSHYELNHKESMSDEIIIELVGTLHSLILDEQARSSSGYSFYQTDVEYKGKSYRLVLTMPPDYSFLGVRNAYRRSK